MHARADAGFTLLELMIVATILAIVAGIGIPGYASALRTARLGKTKHELVTLSNAIDAYTANNGGQLPLTLYQVGFGGRRDPWGVPYCYFNYQSGTGDGLDWAVEAGIIDPSAIVDAGSAVASSGGGAVPRRIGTVPPRAFRQSAQDPQDPRGIDNARSRGGRAIARGHVAAAERITTAATAATNQPVVNADALAESLAVSPQFRVFVGVAPETTRRRDGFLFPLNTDYDLFSLGPNGRTAVSIGHAVAQDDVIRANNGSFFGLASEY